MNCESKGGDFLTSFTRDSTINQGMRGVLTTTGLVDGKEQILTPTKSTPLNRSPRNITSDPYTCVKFGANHP